LFDLASDPFERHNLWGTQQARELQADLQARLLDWVYSDLYRHRRWGEALR